MRLLVVFRSLALLVACAAPTHHVVVVSIDGLMPDAYLHPDAHGLAVPTLRSLVARGMYASAVRGVLPTVTYPSHTTMATGVTPSVHGIVTNKPADPLAKNFDGWRWYAEDIHARTLWDAARDEHRKTALVTWPVTVNAKATFVVPEYWRAGNDDDQKLLRALSTPGLLDAVAREDPDLWKQLTPPDMHDEGQFAIARYLAAHEHPDLLMIHVFALDDAQHDHGPWSKQANAAIENADRLLGTLLATLQAQPEWENTTFVVVSDHGFAPIEHELRPNVVLVKHHLIELDADGATTAAKVAVIASGGMAFVHLLDPAARGELDAALAELTTGVARTLSHDEIVAAGGDPAATVALVAAPGYAFGDKRTGEVITDTPGKGTHGWPPTDPAMMSSFIAIGPDIPRKDLGTIEMTQIAPMLARWLGVTL